MTQRTSIRTRYRGILFKSKLEADYARAFDALGLEWEYELEGRYFGDVFYLPDFWLPRSRQFVEVKGVFEPDDCRKMQALLSHIERRPHTNDDTPDMSLIACEPDGRFRGWVRGRWSDGSWFDFLTRACRDTFLLRCQQCLGWWFADGAGGWGCQCCGAYDGNATFHQGIGSPFPVWPLHPGSRPFYADREAI